MKHRYFTNKTVLWISIVLINLVSSGYAQTAKPNIIFIYSDDVGWTDLGCYGSGFYETPNIDRLRAEGVKFTDAYSGAPICAPARSIVMSGQYIPRTEVYYIENTVTRKNAIKAVKHITEPFTPDLSLDKVSIAEALKPAGYATAHFGKWHLGEYPTYHPSQFGFDEAIESMNFYWDFTTLPSMVIPDETYLSDFMTEHALAFIENNATSQTPFFLYVPEYLAHKSIKSNDPNPRPDAKQDRIDYFDNKTPVGGHKTPVYAAMIYHLDETVGKILDMVDSLGIADNTLIVFASDNGGRAVFDDKGQLKNNSKTDNSPLRGGKGEIYEGGTRVPLICRWPGKIPAGTTCDEAVTSVDFYKTFLDVAGADAPDNYILDGISFLPTLYDPSADLGRDAIYWYIPYYGSPNGDGDQTLFYNPPAAVIRSGDYKLIKFFEDGSLELYNLKNDIGETYDLSLEEPAKVDELHGKLNQWLVDINAPVMERNPQYSPPVPDSTTNSVRNNRFEQGIQHWSLEVDGSAQASISETGELIARTGLKAALVTVTEESDNVSVALVSKKITGDVAGKNMDISCFVKGQAGQVFRTFKIQARFTDQNGTVTSETSQALDLVKVYKNFEFSTRIPNAAVALEVCFLYGKYKGKYFVDDVHVNIPGVVTGIQETGSAQGAIFDVKMYPNPAGSSINIDTNKAIKNIKLYNVLGQVVRSFNKNEKKLPLTNLANGTYFLKVTNLLDHVISKKIYIQN